MPRATYIVRRVALAKPSELRAIAFLSSPHDELLNAEAVMGTLSEKRQRQVRSRFDHWIDGGTNNKWFHGFNAPEHRDCFVFKWKERNQGQRLYGFLCNPRQRTNRRFQLCVLAYHATKNERETDTAELDRVMALMANHLVRGAVQMEFPDGGGGGQWAN